MGNKALGHVIRNAQNVGAQERAFKVVDKIEKGKTKVLAPKYAAEEKYFRQAQQDDDIRKELETKHPELDENLQKFEIQVTEPPPPKVDTSRRFPDRERYNPDNPLKDPEYHFYEPPPEKIPDNKLTFREAIQLMRLNVEKNENPGANEIEKKMSEHLASKRVESEKLNRMHRYFTPFVRIGYIEHGVLEMTDFLDRTHKEHNFNLLLEELEFIERMKEKRRLELHMKQRAFDEDEVLLIEENEIKLKLEEAKKKLLEDKEKLKEREKDKKSSES